MPLRRITVFFSWLSLTTLIACVEFRKPTPEYINAPVNLSISLIGTQTYELSFYSDNREGGFSGYGIFVDPSYSVVDTTPASNDLKLAQMFCEWNAQIYYSFPVNLQVGSAATGIWQPPSSTPPIPDHNVVTMCKFTGNTLASGNYVGVRARVERTDQAWSAAAIVQVP